MLGVLTKSNLQNESWTGEILKFCKERIGRILGEGWRLDL